MTLFSGRSQEPGEQRQRTKSHMENIPNCTTLAALRWKPHCSSQSRNIGDFCCIRSAFAHLRWLQYTSGRLWITKANVPSLKIFCLHVWTLPLTFPIQNQAVGQKGNDYMFSGVSTRFTDWTQPPGNHLHPARLEQRAQMGWGSGVQVNSSFSATSMSSHHHMLIFRCKVHVAPALLMSWFTLTLACREEGKWWEMQKWAVFF